MEKSVIEHAAQNVHLAVADFYLAIQDAKTTHDALALAHQLGVLGLCIGAVEDAALTRADGLCGQHS